MKKTFTLLACASMMLTANAQDAGDYVYTDNGRYKVLTGENLLHNGDFSEGYEGWTTDGGTTLSVDTFAIETEEGNSYLVVNKKDNEAGTGSTLFRKLQVSANYCYVISYQVKGNDDAVTSTATKGALKNYQNFLFSQTGNLYDEDNVSIGKDQTYGFDWTTINYAYMPTGDGYLMLHFYAPYIGTCFDNFKIMTARKVIDDRETAKIIARLQTYLDNPLLPEAHDILEEVIAALQEFVATDDVASYNDMLEYIEDAINAFLEENTGDLTPFVPNLTLDDLPTTSANQTKAGAWTIDDGLRAVNPTGKTRWAVKSASEQNAPFMGNYLQNDIPYGSNNKLYEATVHQTIDNLPAGNYMFTMKLRGYKLLNKNNSRETNVQGMKVFINSDSTHCYPVEDEEATEYIAFSELNEPGSLKIGFYLPDAVANHVDIDFTSLRIIGWTQDQVVEYYLGKEFAEARAALKHNIDSARVWHEDPDMLYGKPQLDSAIVASQAYYDNSTETDSLVDANTRLKKEIGNYISRNATLTAFRQAIANAELLVADESYSEADRQTLNEAIEAAKAYLATLSADNHLTEGYTNADIQAQTALLNEAVNQLLASRLEADEKYEFLTWARQDGAEYTSAIDYSEDIVTSSGATLYKETATFAGHSMGGRFAFRDGLTLSLNASHGLQVNYPSKNQTTMAILNLQEGDQVCIDWTMGNASHNVMVVSANAKVLLADGTWQEYTKTGKDNANVLPKDNSDGLSGSVRSIIQMTADGTLDFYQGSSNSTLRVYYLGYTSKDNVQTGINEVATNNPSDGKLYDLQGRRLSSKPANGLYIQDGKKYVVK